MPPPATKLTLLILEDRAADAKLVVRQLERSGLAVTWSRVSSEEAFVRSLEDTVDVILADYMVPGMDVRRALSLAKERSPDTPFLVVSGALREDLGIELMKLGADDYLMKDRPERLGQAIERSLDRARARRAAREVETRYRGLFEQLPVGFFRISASGPLIDGNAALLRITGFPDLDSLRRVPVLELFADPDERDDLLRRLARDGVITGFETRLTRADGTVSWIQCDMRAVYIDDDGLACVDGLIFDIGDRKRAEEELRRSVEALHLSDQRRKRLLGRLVDAQEAERRRIARDIHDDAVQVMAAVNLRLARLRRRLQDEEQLSLTQKLEETVSLSIGRLRALLFELSPPPLESYGLAAALRAHLDQQMAEADLAWELRSDLSAEPDQDLRLLIYRIAQEALVNVLKHAEATRVSVVLEERDGGVLTRVRDNGLGLRLEAQPAHGHLGLAAMRERAELGGGWWRLESERGEGVTVEFWLPLSFERDGP